MSNLIKVEEWDVVSAKDRPVLRWMDEAWKTESVLE